MVKSKLLYKYRIKEILQFLPKNEYSGVLKALCNKGIKRPTLYSWINIKHEEKRSIPSDSLKIFAAVLNASMEDLYN